MKILFPTDGSDYSMEALGHLVARLRWFAGLVEIAVINVHPHLPYARAVAWAGKEAATRYYDDEGDAALAPASALLGDHGTGYTLVKKIGDPAHEIVKYAGEWGAEVIAMGRHGQSVIAGVLLGSVTQKVIATSPIPALVLK
jgi:nucleotide-binding universal stress UspA family protein